jgi:hypothetical protein
MTTVGWPFFLLHILCFNLIDVFPPLLGDWWNYSSCWQLRMCFVMPCFVTQPLCATAPFFHFQEIDEMIHTVDKNGDGKISFSEFRWVNNKMAFRGLALPQSIEWFIEDQAFSPYDLAPPPPSPVSKLDRRHTCIKTEKGIKLADERGGGVSDRAKHMTARKSGPL